MNEDIVDEEFTDVQDVDLEEGVEAEEDQPRIDVNDLVDCVKVIDLCSKRGAFEGTELSAIGTLRGRLVEFINAVSEPVEDEEAAAE